MKRAQHCEKYQAKWSSAVPICLAALMTLFGCYESFEDYIERSDKVFKCDESRPCASGYSCRVQPGEASGTCVKDDSDFELSTDADVGQPEQTEQTTNTSTDTDTAQSSQVETTENQATATDSEVPSSTETASGTQTITDINTSMRTDTATTETTETLTVTSTERPSDTLTATVVNTATDSLTASDTATTSATDTMDDRTDAETNSETVSTQDTATETTTVSETSTNTVLFTATDTLITTATTTATSSITPTSTATETPDDTETVLDTNALTTTDTGAVTSTETVRVTDTFTGTATTDATSTSTASGIATGTATATFTGTATATSADTATSTASGIGTGTATVTFTGTATATSADTATSTASGTTTSTATGTSSGTATGTSADISTGTVTSTAGGTAAETATETDINADTNTNTATEDGTATSTDTASASETDTSTATHGEHAGECGDGVVDEDEQCDDDGASAVCTANCEFTDNFVSVWEIPADDLTLELPLREIDRDGNALVHAFTVNWGDGTVDEVTSFDSLSKRHTYAEPGVYTVVIDGSGILEGLGMHLDNATILATPNPDAEKLLAVPNLGDLGYKSLRHAFSGCDNLREFSGGVTDQVTDMSNMFLFSVKVTPNVSDWDVGRVLNMSGMFFRASAANPDVRNWDVRNVVDMSGMFRETSSANPDVSRWDVGNVQIMSGLFRDASIANPDVSTWDVGNVTEMYALFSNAVAANPDLSNWSFDSLTPTDAAGNIAGLKFAFSGSGLSTANYSALLLNLAAHPNVQSDITLSIGPTYSAAAQNARDFLVNDRNWVIEDGGVESESATDTLTISLVDTATAASTATTIATSTETSDGSGTTTATQTTTNTVTQTTTETVSTETDTMISTSTATTTATDSLTVTDTDPASETVTAAETGTDENSSTVSATATLMTATTTTHGETTTITESETTTFTESAAQTDVATNTATEDGQDFTGSFCYSANGPGYCVKADSTAAVNCESNSGQLDTQGCSGINFQCCVQTCSETGGGVAGLCIGDGGIDCGETPFDGTCPSGLDTSCCPTSGLPSEDTSSNQAGASGTGGTAGTSDTGGTAGSGGQDVGLDDRCMAYCSDWHTLVGACGFHTCERSCEDICGLGSASAETLILNASEDAAILDKAMNSGNEAPVCGKLSLQEYIGVVARDWSLDTFGCTDNRICERFVGGTRQSDTRWLDEDVSVVFDGAFEPFERAYSISDRNPQESVDIAPGESKALIWEVKTAAVPLQITVGFKVEREFETNNRPIPYRMMMVLYKESELIQELIPYTTDSRSTIERTFGVFGLGSTDDFTLASESTYSVVVWLAHTGDESNNEHLTLSLIGRSIRPKLDQEAASWFDKPSNPYSRCDTSCYIRGFLDQLCELNTSFDSCNSTNDRCDLFEGITEPNQCGEIAAELGTLMCDIWFTHTLYFENRKDRPYCHQDVPLSCGRYD